MNKIIKKAAVILTIFAMLISAVPVYAASVSISKKKCYPVYWTKYGFESQGTEWKSIVEIG